jgi:hypothetical protein
MQQPNYNNTCLDITSQATPDPFVTYANGKYYFTFTAGDRIPLWEADSLTDFFEEGKFKKGPVWYVLSSPVLIPTSYPLQPETSNKKQKIPMIPSSPQN